MGRGRAPHPPRAASALILDAGAVIALARGAAPVRAAISRAVQTGAKVFIPAVVVAETFRGHGPRDAPVNRVLDATEDILPVTEVVGRTAGALLGRTGSAETIDALVVATAILLGGAHIYSSAPDDLRVLAAETPEVQVQPV